jgi:hypothetical protein
MESSSCWKAQAAAAVGLGAIWTLAVLPCDAARPGAHVAARLSRKTRGFLLSMLFDCVSGGGEDRSKWDRIRCRSPRSSDDMKKMTLLVNRIL